MATIYVQLGPQASFNLSDALHGLDENGPVELPLPDEIQIVFQKSGEKITLSGTEGADLSYGEGPVIMTGGQDTISDPAKTMVVTTVSRDFSVSTIPTPIDPKLK